MPRFRKSKRPAGSTPTPPTEPVQNVTPRGSSMVFATSSTSTAHSSASPFNNTRNPSSDGTAVGGKDTAWQTAYAAARMAVEVAKESSDMFLPLKAVAGAMTVLIRNYDQKSDNVEMVKEIEQRVQSLSSVLASPVSEDDHAEKGRRAKLRRKLEGVIIRLEPLSKQHTLIGFLRNTDNAKTLTGFTQELVNAITDYQVSVHQGVYEKTRNIHNDTRNIHDDTKNILEAADLEILAKLEPIRNAGYQAGHHEKCLPGTRESVLEDTLLWAKTPQDQNVFWLNGLAGTGKSTIAQSFSEAVSKDGFLGASFFCSRNYLDRKELKNIFPTLAYQLACHYSHFRCNIITNLKKDPTLAHTSLISQLENLLVKPFLGTTIPCVIVIDALDECVDDQPASAILSVLGRFAKQLPLVKFFITGRPEPRVRTGFRLPLLQPLTRIFMLHQVELSSISNDIQLYLAQKLTAIAKRRSDVELPDPWPHDYEIEALTKKSSGLFIFASTLVRFIESEHHEPNERLQLVLSRASGTRYEGYAGIDSLYSQILLHAFSDVHESQVFVNVRHILGAITLAFNPLSRRDLSVILGIPTPLILTTLRHLHSVILVPIDEHKEICVFHKSFPDFLQDKERCTDVRFCLDVAIQHSDMALNCLELVKKLERNPCSLPPYTMNQDIVDLPQLLENRLGGVRYACSYWARHIELSPTSGDTLDQIVVSTTKMLRSSGLPWIEVMSLENQLEEVAHSMHCLLDWLDNPKVMAIVQHELTTSTKNKFAIANLRKLVAGRKHAAVKQANASIALCWLATDLLRLSIRFFHPIQHCAQQVYHSALPLSPTTSLQRESSLQSIMDNQLSYVTAFLSPPKDWGLLLRTIDIRPNQLTCITTSTQNIIAACEDVVYIYGAVTGVLRQTICAPERVENMQGSPDGMILFFVHSLSITMWDVQTGGLIHTFTVHSKISDIAVSPMGDHIACGMSDGCVTIWDIHTKEGRGFVESELVITVYWLSFRVLAVATQDALYIHDTARYRTLDKLSCPGHVWGMVYLEDKGEFLVGTCESDPGWYIFNVIKYEGGHLHLLVSKHQFGPEVLTHPILVGNMVVCMAPPSGVQLLIASNCSWTENPPLLDAATSMAVSLNRNLVVQTKDSIQIFSLDVLTSCKEAPPPHIYPLDEERIICLQPDGYLTLLGLGTLQKLSPGITSGGSLKSLLTNQLASAPASFGCGLVGKFGASPFKCAWETGAPLPTWLGMDEEAPLGKLSPGRTRIVTVHQAPSWELRVLDVKQGHRLAAHIPLAHRDPGTGEIYEITFDSESRFYLKVEGPGLHVQTPCDIIPSPSKHHSHAIIEGESVPLSKPRATPPYTLDANCEWVLDTRSRKICWIPPGNIRRGSGGHFWAGLSLVMAGEDGVVRKLTFRKPDR